jgi:3-oxoacyl-[acyl-carrier protein] reductase
VPHLRFSRRVLFLAALPVPELRPARFFATKRFFSHHLDGRRNTQPKASTEKVKAMGKLAGQVAVVTGASKGIGAAISEALAAEGASVVVNYSSSRDGAERVVRNISAAGGKAIAVQADVSKEPDIVRLFAETKKAFGKLNILVNNAGVYEFAPLGDVSAEHFRKMFDLNVLGLLLTTREAVKLIGPEGGSIINIGSGVSTIFPPNSSVYTATKASVDAITAVLSKELGPRKIRVNSINPGMIQTEGVRTAGFDGGDFRKWIETTASLGRIGQTDDIAPTAVYLASSDSKYLTGEFLRVTGGIL